MKTIFVTIMILLVAVFASADSLVSDSMTSHIGVNFQIWQASKGLGDAQVEATGNRIADKEMELDGSIKYNLDYLPTGTFNWYVRACHKAYVYGPNNTLGGSSVCSVFVPFDFTKRSPVNVPITGLKLVQ